jgi:ribosomal protein S7
MIPVKNKMLNHLLLDGKKKTCEKILLRSFKELQKFSKKQSTKLISLAIVCSMPLFKIHQLINKNKKKKNVKEIPTVVTTLKARISLAIKFILKNLKNKKLHYFYTRLYTEILHTVKNESLAVQLKNDVQKQVLLKKHFLFFYT